MRDFVPIFPCRSIPKIDEMMNEAEPCRLCWAPNDALTAMVDLRARFIYAISCSVCNHIGPEAGSLHEAIAAWNQEKPL